jgi:hypothetical protein
MYISESGESLPLSSIKYVLELECEVCLSKPPTKINLSSGIYIVLKNLGTSPVIKLSSS